MKTKLKLFIWTNFCPDYSGGLAFAIARDEADAKKLVIQQEGYDVSAWGTLEVKPLTMRIARSVVGGM